MQAFHLVLIASLAAPLAACGSGNLKSARDYNAPAAPPVMAATAPVAAAAVTTFPNGKPMFDASGQPASPKSRLVALLLILLFNVLGIQRFYVGKIGTGILYLITLGGLGIWFLIDLVMIIVGSFKDKQGRVLSNW
jgi:TM2 domain-containing membrane protein YozV